MANGGGVLPPAVKEQEEDETAEDDEKGSGRGLKGRRKRPRMKRPRMKRPRIEREEDEEVEDESEEGRLMTEEDFTEARLKDLKTKISNKLQLKSKACAMPPWKRHLASWMPSIPEGQRILIADRHTISLQELKELQEEQHIGLICVTGGHDLYASAASQFKLCFAGWNCIAHAGNAGAIVLWNPDYWCVEEVRQTDLFEESLYHGVLIFKLRRATTRSDANAEQVLAMLTTLRTHRPHSDQDMRKDIIEALIGRAHTQSPGKWLVAGRLENPLEPWTMKKILQCVDDDINPCRLFSRNRMLGCMAEGVDLAECQSQQDAAVLILEMEWISEDISGTSSSRVTTTGGETSIVRLLPYYDCFMRAIDNTKSDGIECLAPLLYGPRLPYRWALDGSLLLPASSQKECERKLDFALKVFQEARSQGRRSDTVMARQDEITDYGTLKDHQMDKALAWLKIEYGKKYMTLKKTQAVQCGLASERS
jgi:hypothetical protein